LPEKNDQILYGLFKQSNTYLSYECIYSNYSKYQEKKYYPLYRMDCLVRLLGKKNNLFTKTLASELSEADQEIAKITKWTKEEKVVFIFSLKNGPLDPNAIEEITSRELANG